MNQGRKRGGDDDDIDDEDDDAEDHDDEHNDDKNDDKVDEEGSEAAALSGIILDIRTARVPQVVTVDRQVIINA